MTNFFNLNKKKKMSRKKSRKNGFYVIFLQIKREPSHNNLRTTQDFFLRIIVIFFTCTILTME